MKSKFLFINAIDPSEGIQTVYPPLGIGYLISSLREKFGKDACEFKVVDSAIEEEIKGFNPDIVGISSTTQNYTRAIAYAKLAKQYGRPVICGGVHITMLPSSLTRDMDIGVIGEGEHTICDLFEMFLENRSFNINALEKIKGITYWNALGSPATTERRDLIGQLDGLPLPARDVLDIQENTYMFTSRGCPYRCAFCASSRFWSKVRFFSAEYVVNEIEFLMETYNIKRIAFYDDIFSVDVKRVKKIVELLRSKKILGKIKFDCSIRANLVNDEIITLLKEMGVQTIHMGLESGCNETLKYLKKGNIDLSDNENAVRIIKKHKIPMVTGSFIIGSPMEDRKNVLETLRFIKKIKLDYFVVYVLTPFPGTPVWEYARSKGLVSENMDWETLSVNFADIHHKAVVLSEKLTREEIWELFQKFKSYQARYQVWRRLFLLIAKGLKNPRKIPSFLSMKCAEYLGRYKRLPAG